MRERGLAASSATILIGAVAVIGLLAFISQNEQVVHEAVEQGAAQPSWLDSAAADIVQQHTATHAQSHQESRAASPEEEEEQEDGAPAPSDQTVDEDEVEEQWEGVAAAMKRVSSNPAAAEGMASEAADTDTAVPDDTVADAEEDAARMTEEAAIAAGPEPTNSDADLAEDKKSSHAADDTSKHSHKPLESAPTAAALTGTSLTVKTEATHGPIDQHGSWKLMHGWWIKLKQNGKSLDDIKAAKMKCLEVNIKQQTKCGKIYCDSGETPKCGGVCKKDERGHIYLTPLEGKDFYQASEKDTKERKAKEHAAKTELKDKAAHEKELKGRKITAANNAKMVAVKAKLAKEKSLKAAQEMKSKQVALKGELSLKALEAKIAKTAAEEKKVKDAQKIIKLSDQHKTCNKKAKKTKTTCVAVELSEKVSLAVGSAKVQHEEKKEQAVAMQKGQAALKKEIAEKQAAHDKAIKELKAKADEALPPNLPKGGFKWDLEHPCDAGAGKFSQLIKKDAKVVVGTIPKGKVNVRVDLKSKKDVDVQLWDGSNGKAIVAWMEGKIDSSGEACDKWAGMKVCYSGYLGVDYEFGNEWISIEGKATRPLVVKAYGYDEGHADVFYKWDGQPASSGCKNPVVPPVVQPNPKKLLFWKQMQPKASAQGSAATSAASAVSLFQASEGPEGTPGRRLLLHSGSAAGAATLGPVPLATGSGSKPAGDSNPLTSALCEKEAKEAKVECEMNKAEALDKQFQVKEKAAKQPSGLLLKKEANKKQAKKATLAKKEGNLKSKKAKLDKKLDKATKAWQKEASAKGAELAAKAKKRAARIAKEKAEKAGAPERDAKERQKKAQPKCEAAKKDAMKGCAKVTDDGYEKCAAIYWSVPMAKEALRPFSYSEGLENTSGVHKPFNVHGAATGSAATMTTIETGSQTRDQGKSHAAHELRKLEALAEDHPWHPADQFDGPIAGLPPLEKQ